MKITFTTLFIGLMFSAMAVSSLPGDQSRFSNSFKSLWLHVQRDDIQDPVVTNRFALYTINGEQYAGALVKISPLFSREAARGQGVLIGADLDELLSVKIPLLKLYDFASLSGITYIEVDKNITGKLKESRAASYVDDVHAGSDLSQPFTGEGVIVGVMDFSFDLRHPAFFTEDGETSRIAQVWHQDAENGVTPTGYDYGALIEGELDLWDYDYTSEDGSHGTHVAGIAAGGGFGSNGIMTGMAPGAEMILVENGAGESALSDAIAYVFDYAEGEGKPAVINMSLGTHMGPHDGTSLQDQAFDVLAGDGKILVGAAGNEGETPLHLGYQFENQDTMYTMITFEPSEFQTGAGSIDLWGSAFGEFEVGFVLNTADLNYWENFEYLVSSDFDDFTDTMIVFDGVDSIYIEITAEARNPENNKPHVSLYIENNTDWIVEMKVTSQDDFVDIWNHGTGYGAALTNEHPVYGEIEYMTAGDTWSTIGEIGGTGKSVITVGAYTTTNSYTNIFDEEIEVSAWSELGDIAPFSSLGPTADNRVKPEITAPGNVIFSAINSWDPEYQQGGGSEETIGLEFEGYSWAALEGTSMATPAVVGIIALALQADPTLDYADVVNLFELTAYEDEWTGALNGVANNVWGWGKIDAWTMMDHLNLSVGVEANVDQGKLNIFPNPVSLDARINFKNPVEGVLQVVDATGVVVYQANAQQSMKLNLEAGVYMLRLTNSEGILSSKLMVK